MRLTRNRLCCVGDADTAKRTRHYRVRSTRKSSRASSVTCEKSFCQVLGGMARTSDQRIIGGSPNLLISYRILRYILRRRFLIADFVQLTGSGGKKAARKSKSPKKQQIVDAVSSTTTTPTKRRLVIRRQPTSV